MNIKNLSQKSINELKSSGIPTPELDAHVLLTHTIKKDSSFIFSHPEYQLSILESLKFKKLLHRRKTGEPIAYILRHKEFFGYDFLVNINVLIPRPESEWLVEKSVGFLQNYELRINNKARGINIIDIGTGSGCIIISLAKNLSTANSQQPATNLYASDISRKALRIAKQNSKKLLFRENRELKKFSLRSNNKIQFYLSDLFSNKNLREKKFDLILANLPYVPREGKFRNSKFEIRNKSGIDFEPQNAIFADDNGSAIIKKFLTEARDKINKNGMILIELDPRNSKELCAFAKKEYPKAKIELEKDLAGLDRYLQIIL